ncbi:MAG: hypothetical protein WCK77_14060 [Verrucomicrobiota bacterium]
MIPNEADRGPAADPDGDGFTNLQECLFGTSPVANTGSPTTFEGSPGGLIVRWSERANATYVLQESTTLEEPWSTSSATITDAIHQTGVATDYVRKQASIPLDSPQKFVRVQAAE